MKKLTILLSLFCLLQAANGQDFFFNVSGGCILGGPGASMKKDFQRNGYGDVSTGSFMGFTWNTDYPEKGTSGMLTLRAGKKLGENITIYGMYAATKGWAEGFNETGGMGGIMPFYGGNVGITMRFDYRIKYLAAGMQWPVNSGKLRLAAAPMLCVLSHSMKTGWERNKNRSSYTNSLLPGLNTSVRIPIGRNNKLVAGEFFLDGNFSGKASVAATFDESKQQVYPARKVSTTCLSAGMAIGIYKRSKK